jgi:N-acetylmuramoyl-L-alanine amidase
MLVWALRLFGARGAMPMGSKLGLFPSPGKVTYPLPLTTSGDSGYDSAEEMCWSACRKGDCDIVLNAARKARQNRVRVITLFWALIIAVIAPSIAESGRVKVYLEKGSLALTSVRVDGAEYLSLTNLAKALKAPLERLPTHGRYQIRLEKSSILLTVGSPEVRLGRQKVSLSESPRRMGRAVLAPLDLLPIALGARYGEGRVTWDPDARVARVTATPFSLRLLRFRTYGDHTRVVLEGTRRHDFVLKDDGTSGRVILEVKRGALSPSIRRIQVNDGLLASIEPRQLRRDSQIIIQGAGHLLWSRAFALEQPDRIVVDLLPRLGQDGGSPGSVEKAAPARADPAEPAPRTAAPAKPLETFPPGEIVRTVVIDPGHGGRDTGAVGPSGVREKDVVLDLGLRLKRLIEETLGLKVVMTRSDDVFVPLEQRTAIANRHKADFFISLHVNAAPKSRAVGFETYFLSREPSDRGARASAVRENMVLNLEGVGQEEQRGLKAVLWDLAQTFYVRESSELAELLLNELGLILKVDNRGVKSAPFFVLIGAAMPSVLVESAFITNPHEERKLQREAYRQQVAEALLAGVEKFMERYERRVGLMRAGGSS